MATAIFSATEKDVESWGGAALVKEADSLARRGDIRNVTFADGIARGEIRYSSYVLKTSFRLISNRMIDSLCPCSINKVGGRVCVHVVAVGLVLAKRAHGPVKLRVSEEEMQRAKAVAEAEAKDEFVHVAARAAGGIPAEIKLRLQKDWENSFWNPESRIVCECHAAIAGDEIPLNRIPGRNGIALSKEDHALLAVLEDICEHAPPEKIEFSKADFLSVLSLLASQGRPVNCAGRSPMVFRNETAAAIATLDLDRENGELLIFASAEIPGENEPDPFARIVAHGNLGFVSAKGCLWGVSGLLPSVYQSVYGDMFVVKRDGVARFLREELPRLIKMPGFRTEIDADLFEFEKAKPSFSLRVKGSQASIAVSLFAVYGDGKESHPAAQISHFGIPDDDDIMRYGVQNFDAERRAVGRLNAMGFGGANGSSLAPVSGERNVLNFLGSGIPELRRLGWKVDVGGMIGESYENMTSAVPVVRISSGIDYFDVSLDVQQTDGASITPSDVQSALLRGESFLHQGDEIILLDTGSINAMRSVFSDCSSRDGAAPGSFRLDSVYSSYVQASLASLDGVDVEQPPGWRAAAEAGNKQENLEPVDLGDRLNGILRPYQKEGVSWLRFLENNGLCGILADEMGLGKTLQTLSWLHLRRSDPESEGKPALIVCPTSLVENWRHEAEQFTPDMKIICISGSKRHELWDKVAEQDIIVTSYALLRRDIEHYLGMKFSCAVLDEAQHIKNRSTQNSLAAKQIAAVHKLVLTGTPVENGVADLWSIMDFLMPGYLGRYEDFRINYELPLSDPENPESSDVQTRLRRKLHPFLLRRKKETVAKDLPAKLIKVSFCPLSPDQRVVYNGILEKSRKQISGMISEKGFDKSRMEILAILMKLRQVCCHLALLKDGDLAAKAREPSSKTDHFFDLLDEAIDGGHRMLVFSQFVGMLTLLREELERRGIRYSYLDGSTKDRLERCHEFNHDTGIPVFLISLKAGGTGLNLTGADMVVHFDPWWNPAVEDQATDRAHRIGQKKTVYAVKLITSDTVEEKVLMLQKRKQAIIGATVEGDEQTMSKLTWNDVKDIIGL